LISENQPAPAAPPAEPAVPAGPKRSTLMGWRALFLVPNLLTVPGDALAGFLLTGYPGYAAMDIRPAIPCAVAAALLYGAGLAANDFFDRDKDRVSRPERPIPSGLVRPAAALTVSIVLAIAGVAVAALAGTTAAIIAWSLAVAIAIYDAGLKDFPMLGSLNMGVCRGLSLMLGAAAAGQDVLLRTPVLISAVGMTVYVAALTFLATKETNKERIGNSRELPGLAIILWFVLMYNFAGLPNRLMPSMIAAIAAANWAFWCVDPIRSKPTPKVIQRTIGDLVRGLLLIQAALAAVVFWPGIIVAGALVAAFLLFGPLARRFSPS